MLLFFTETLAILNAMTVWKINDDFDPEIFIKHKAITHLYLRTIHPGNGISSFVMIHARSEDELQDCK